MKVWAFNGADDGDKKAIYDSIKNGKSRFGWSQKDEHNLKLKDNWTDCHSRQLFLLEITKGDWIVHINTPELGKCIAGQVISDYDFDEGIQCAWGLDFRHNFSLDSKTIVEFSRTDSNILTSVNLRPRYRFHRVYAVDDFLKSIENVKNNKVELADDETSEEHHLKMRTNEYLKKITRDIHEMHAGKKLEHFIARVMRKIPDVVDVRENGSGWGTDHGADLIITLHSTIGKFDFEHKIIVQVKSYEGQHYDLNSVNQIKVGIEKFQGTAGMLITTGERTPELEKEIATISNKIGHPIHLLCGDDVARFVLENAPDLLFNLQ